MYKNNDVCRNNSHHVIEIMITTIKQQHLRITLTNDETETVNKMKDKRDDNYNATLIK